MGTDFSWLDYAWRLLQGTGVTLAISLTAMLISLAGGLILGIVEAFVSGFVSSTFRDAAAFAILILVLLFKPAGLFGKNTREKV